MPKKSDLPALSTKPLKVPGKKKTPINFKISERTRSLLIKLAEAHDCSHTAVFESLIEEKARLLKISE